MASKTITGLNTKQAFKRMLDNPEIELNDKKVLRYRMNNDKISLDKMIEMLTANGFKCVQDKVWIQA